MKTKIAIALLASLPLLGACADRDEATTNRSPPADHAEPETAIGRSVAKAMDKARAKLATENINLTDMHIDGDGHGIRIDTGGGKADGRPKAELTPAGELLIEGRKVEANAEQQALLQQYRQQIEGVANSGMDIGAQGAELGVTAAKEALLGIFNGDTDGIEQRVEAEAEGIKAAVRELCDQLPAMKTTQDALAASMPEFRPYATLDQSDIDDCYEDDAVADVHREVRQEVQQEVRDNIRQGIRGGIQTAAQAAGIASRGTVDDADASPNAAEEAEAASAEDATQQ